MRWTTLVAVLSVQTATVLADPAQGAWAPPDPNGYAPGSPVTVTALADGRVLVANATDQGGGDQEPAARLFNPRSGGWTDLATRLPLHAAAALLADGRVLLVDSHLRSFLYDPVRDRVTSGTALTGLQPLGSFTLTALPAGPVSLCGSSCGKVLLAGGCDYSRAVGELYDPSAGRWGTPIPMVATERCHHSATLLAHGRVLIAGGTNLDQARVFRSAELFDPVAVAFVPTGSQHYARFNQTASTLADGRVLVVGESAPVCSPSREENGCFTPVRQRGAELYDPATGRWSDTGDTLEAVNRDSGGGYAAARLPDGRVLLVVGAKPFLANQRPLTSDRVAELYNPSKETWSYAAPPPGPVPGFVDVAVALMRQPCGGDCGRVLILTDHSSLMFLAGGGAGPHGSVAVARPSGPPVSRDGVSMVVVGVAVVVAVVVAAVVRRQQQRGARS